MAQKKTQNKFFLKSILINNFMLNGKKETSEKIVSQSFKITQKNSLKETNSIFKTSLKNISPVLDSIKIKNRKSFKHIPFFLIKPKRISNSIKIIVHNSKDNKQRLTDNFYKLLISSAANNGKIKEKIKELHNNSFVNKNFSHYRWF